MSTSTTPNKVTLSAGEQAPRFTLTDDHNNTVSLDDYAGKRVIVYFYPRANTPGCTKEACDFRDKYDLTFPLLSDPDKTVMQEWGAFGEKKNYGKVVQGVIRSTFLVDPIALAKYNVKATGHVARIIKELNL